MAARYRSPITRKRGLRLNWGKAKYPPPPLLAMPGYQSTTSEDNSQSISSSSKVKKNFSKTIFCFISELTTITPFS